MNKATIYIGDALETLRTLPDASVHCCVTSPPYWGHRDYGEDGQMGLETTPAEYVAGMTAVFEEVRRVLRDDGTLWLNIGDSYFAGGWECSRRSEIGSGSMDPADRKSGREAPGLKVKDLVGIPWRLAFALQDAGWYLRCDIIWSKGNPMPESVTDRPTKAHEYVFLLAKSARYFYDHEAVKEPSKDPEADLRRIMGDRTKTYSQTAQEARRHGAYRGDADEDAIRAKLMRGRNRRSVWSINTRPFPGAHFAVYPPDLVEPCVKAGTSEHGCCPACGSPWERVTKKPEEPDGLRNRDNGAKMDYHARQTGSGAKLEAWRRENPTQTTGWEPTCECGKIKDPIPCTVLDPFNGAGTSGVVALALGRDYVGVELNPEYAQMAAERIGGDAPMFNRVEIVRDDRQEAA